MGAPAPAPAEPAPAESAPADPAVSAPAAATGAGGVDRDSVVVALADVVLPGLKGVARAIWSNGRVVEVSGSTAVFEVENEPTQQRAERTRADVEALLASHLGAPVHIRLRVAGAPDDGPAGTSPRRREPADRRPPGQGGEGPEAPDPATAPGVPSTEAPSARAAADGPAAPAPAEYEPATDESADDEVVDVDELEDAVDVVTSGLDRLTAAFPGAVLIDNGEVNQ